MKYFIYTHAYIMNCKLVREFTININQDICLIYTYIAYSVIQSKDFYR